MRKCAIALFAATTLVPPVMAQERVNIGIWGTGLLGQAALRSAEAATRQHDPDRRGRSGSSTGQRSSVPEGMSKLSFVRSGNVTDQIETAVAERLQEIVSLRFRMDGPSDLVKAAGTRAIYQSELKSRNLPEDSVSGATALFLAIGWELANGRKLSAAQNAAILRQTTNGLQATPLARQSNAHRQQEAEMRLIISALWLKEADFRADAPALVREMSDSVWKDMMAITGNDMRAYAVTATGFTKA